MGLPGWHYPNTIVHLVFLRDVLVPSMQLPAACSSVAATLRFNGGECPVDI